LKANSSASRRRSCRYACRYSTRDTVTSRAWTMWSLRGLQIARHQTTRMTVPYATRLHARVKVRSHCCDRTEQNWITSSRVTFTDHVSEQCTEIGRVLLAVRSRFHYLLNQLISGVDFIASVRVMTIVRRVGNESQDHWSISGLGLS